MFKFDKYYFNKLSLFEGGNVTVKKGGLMGGNVTVKLQSAQKIPVDQLSNQQFTQFKQEIIGVLRGINKQFTGEIGKPLWPELDNLIDSGKIFSGSTRILFIKPLNEIKKYKQTFGDIDLQYPEELKDDLEEFLNNNEDQKFGNMTFFGMGGNSPNQFNTIFKTTVLPDDVTNIQIDFEPTYWENNEPSEFATFAHYSSWTDMKANVKGAFSKLLMRSLVREKEKLGDVAVLTPTGKISKSVKHDNPNLRGFSVDKGMRVKYEPIVDNRGEQKTTEDGRPIYQEISTKKSDYEKDLNDIFGFVFGIVPTDDEIQKAHSYVGLLQLMKKYLDDETIEKVFNTFINIIWGTEGQEIEKCDEFINGINYNDYEVKRAAYDQFIKVFHELAMDEDSLRDFILPFYDKLAKRKMK